MNWKRIASMLLFCIAALAVMLACSISGVPLLSQAEPTATKRATRVARATFTPRPPATETPEPSLTDEPTSTDEPTAVPVTETPRPATKRPVTPKPTNPPAPPPATPIPQPTKSPFQYSFIPATSCNTTDPAVCNVQGGVTCSHSGQHTIKVLVYANYKDPGSALAGVKVRVSGSPGGPMIEPDEETVYDGVATKTLSNVTDAPGKNVGNYFAWLVNSSGNPISDFSSVIPINDKQPEDPQVCWVGIVSFAGGK